MPIKQDLHCPKCKKVHKANVTPVPRPTPQDLAAGPSHMFTEWPCDGCGHQIPYKIPYR